MRHYRWVLLSVLVTLAPGAAAAQNDTTAEAPRAAMLRRAIEDRFTARVQRDLQLDDQQVSRLRATSEQYSARRREVLLRQRRLRQALAGQLRPGVAADADSVARLTQELMDARVALAEAARDEVQDVGKFLTPVQRARYLLLRERLLQRIEQVRDARVRRLRQGLRRP